MFFVLAEENDAMTYCRIFVLVVICRRKKNGGDLSQPSNREEKIKSEKAKGKRRKKKVEGGVEFKEVQ